MCLFIACKVPTLFCNLIGRYSRCACNCFSYAHVHIVATAMCYFIIFMFCVYWLQRPCVSRFKLNTNWFELLIQCVFTDMCITFMNKYLHKFTSLSVQHRLDLFEKSITPILNYGSHVGFCSEYMY